MLVRTFLALAKFRLAAIRSELSKSTTVKVLREQMPNWVIHEADEILRAAPQVTDFGRELSDQLLMFATTALVANEYTRLKFGELQPSILCGVTWGQGQVDAFMKLAASAESLFDAFDKLANEVPPH